MSFRSRVSKLSMGAVALATLSLLTPSAQAAAPESPDPVKIALMDWTSVNLNANIRRHPEETRLQRRISDGGLFQPHHRPHQRRCRYRPGILGHHGRRCHEGLGPDRQDDPRRQARAERRRKSGGIPSI